MSPCESPLTLIEKTAHGSCRSTTASEGLHVRYRLSYDVCMCEGETCWAVNQSEPVLGHFSQCCFFCVIGRYNGAFSRWFPAGLHMTCDNITVLKGQAWREAVGVAEAGLRLSKPRLHSSAPTVMCLVFRGNALLLIFKYLVFNTLPKRQCQYLQYELNLDSLCCRCREGVALLACW